ncbi:uncharacterized protein si:dkey-261l7.2 isoform X2 [Lampris incognitus]|uniref:uncharacterized protein si:dkey-261l7.2 isoform X2 n=1 Tax=Lampris incognitus TaxID=2546036 RepID=UPI0024B5E956|nr:uncharacterized protein si:dkey-261l7.2 isoform X2 [Lampris incognitus]
MPQFTAATVLQITLLLSALPAQYFISRWCGTTAAQRHHATARLLKMWKELRTSYLNGNVWMEWATLQMSKLKSLVGLGEEASAESLAIEVMLYDNDHGFFGASKEVRSPRPPFVFLRVGDVVMQRTDHMVGVVIKAENTPHYKVLFSGPGPSSLFVAYLPQTQLDRITGLRPDIPTLEHYFTHFDGERFIMQPWLSEIFPEDEYDS